MAELPDHYDALLELPEPMPSIMTALLPPEAEAPGVTQVIAHLEASGAPMIEREAVGAPEIDGARWQLNVTLQSVDDDDEGEEPRLYRIWLEPSEKLDEIHVEWSHLTEEDTRAAQASDWSVGIEAVFTGVPLLDFQEQVRVLSIVAPEAVVMLDHAACWPRPALWMHEVAGAPVPPSPENLFCVHAVTPDDGGADEKVWLHTHGLLRCGTFELEMLDVPRDHAGLLCGVLNAAASLCIENGPPEPDEPFLVGAGLELVWLPWEQGIKQVSGGIPGAKGDRDDYHSHPSCVLFAPGKKVMGMFGSRYKSPAEYVPVLEDNPVLYISNMETIRMGMLAQERLGIFVELFGEHGGSDEWGFLVKLGYVVDDAESESDREHLWFEVQAAGEDWVEATLLNEPYHIARMHEGERGRHELALLSDWNVFCPWGRFDPDSVVHLVRALSEGLPPPE